MYLPNSRGIRLRVTPALEDNNPGLVLSYGLLIMDPGSENAQRQNKARADILQDGPVYMKILKVLAAFRSTHALY